MAETPEFEALFVGLTSPPTGRIGVGSSYFEDDPRRREAAVDLVAAWIGERA